MVCQMSCDNTQHRALETTFLRWLADEGVSQKTKRTAAKGSLKVHR